MTDRYTKTVLTVIALCLIWLSVKDTRLESTISAQSQSEMQAAISYCWDLATIQRETDSRWKIHTYC
jgi:hypothetical protein